MHACTHRLTKAYMPVLIYHLSGFETNYRALVADMPEGQLSHNTN